MLQTRIDKSKVGKQKSSETDENNKLRVLHIDNDIGETSASYNEHILSKVDEYDISVCIFFPSPIDVPSTVKLFQGNGSIRSFVRILKVCLKSTRYDIVHIHAPHVGLLFILSVLFYKPQLLKRIVYTVHNSHQNYSLRNRIIMMLPFLLFGKIVHCSWSSFNSFPWLFRFLAGGRRTAVPNGVDVDRVSSVLTDEMGQLSEQSADRILRICSIGRLVPIKNFSTLIDAFVKCDLPNIALDIFGEGVLREELETEIRVAEVEEKLTLRGIVPRDQVFREISQSDVYISTSFGEGLPIAVMEAMCCGCPVILSDIPPHRELADACDFIFLVPANDSQGFANELYRILTLEMDERKVLGEKARDLVKERFSLETMHAGYSKIYNEFSS